MKRYASVIVFAFMMFTIACNSGDRLVIENTLNIDRPDELIVLKRTDLEKQVGAIAKGKFILAKEKGSDAPIVVQYDDMDGDGEWDEIAFLSSIIRNETKQFLFSTGDAPATVKAVVRAHVRHIKKNADSTFGAVITKDTMPSANPPTDFTKVPLPPYLTEGPAWENDKVAFRLYFDTRNGKDIFGKTTRGMVMDTVGANHNNSYHELSDWGMDILHVGKSLGAGALAFQVKQAGGKDTIIRLGGSIVTSENYEALADGPIRAIFKMTYHCVINNQPFVLTDVMSIWGGQYFYQSDVTLSAVPAGVQLVCGMANFNEETFGYLHVNDTRAIFSYGPMSENKDRLGVAIAVPDKLYVDAPNLTDSLAEVRDSHGMILHVSAGKPAPYRFYAGWEKSDPAFTTQKGFMDYLNHEVARFGTPVTLTWY